MKLRFRKKSDSDDVEIFSVDDEGEETLLPNVLYAAITVTKNNPPTALIKCVVDEIDLEATNEAG